ncbi:MAG: hypothetical protein HC827_24115 [Cyanobacteria bacterium RM1_2_2]|nr:hypothetical protein [Cyanobacteria bacterium RM1_2_2]
MHYDPYALMQTRYEQQERIAESWYSNGCNDALLGKLPEWKDEAYLAGYLSGIRQLPADDAGRILSQQIAPPD